MKLKAKSCYDSYCGITVSFRKCNVNLRLSKFSIKTIFLNNESVLIYVSVHDFYVYH
jgi:hypothetical protein